ncbi:hypothetical protein FACS1894199_11940 [Bacteroidia bacterium]|nr:hypothetical protein FACS1894199_11940 [Bacteroidia bacterium]
MDIVALLRKYYSKIDRRILTYLTCVLVASGLWALNKLNKSYTTAVSYALIFTNVPKDMHLQGKPPDKINMELEATGFALLRHQISSVSELKISLQGLRKQVGSDKEDYTLTASELKEIIANQLSSSIQIAKISPNEISLRFAQVKSKLVKIESDVKYRLKQGYILKGKVKCTPDSVLVTGPSTVVNNIKKVSTATWDAGELSKMKKANIELLAVDGAELQTYDTDLTIDAERFTEAIMSIDITPTNVPEKLNMNLFPKDVEIRYEVGLSRYDKMSSTDFRFVVVYDSINTSPYLQVKPDIVPPFVQNVRYSPQKVEYILEKKKD